MRFAKESSSSKAKHEVSAIAIEPINIANTTTNSVAPVAPRAARHAERGIIIREAAPQEPTPKEVPEGKGRRR